MKASLLAAWTAALRSGEYSQGKLNFERNNKFCCLGVLCKVAGEPTIIRLTGNWPFVARVIGIPGHDTRLAIMNDEGTPFPQIADWIEANIPITETNDIKDTL